MDKFSVEFSVDVQNFSSGFPECQFMVVSKSELRGDRYTWMQKITRSTVIFVGFSLGKRSDLFPSILNVDFPRWY